MGMYRFAIGWLGEGLLIAGGEKWARSRRLLTPAFHFDILKPYVHVGNRVSDILLVSWGLCCCYLLIVLVLLTVLIVIVLVLLLTVLCWCFLG